ncbi:hypothetical protein OG453_42225 [Streptomyces sp. NBC_01381]|uniref:hypothetical protein n=1 Tax=Streptomyces sp. NBC_01381 TaxID=2903845 RepID=UPI002251F4F6|nr:hypothetical protein [Streptomyces sp. NBC_01381]MCX4673179.1 hypothetical protein [Streptomyces sp. NBC_01381]
MAIAIPAPSAGQPAKVAVTVVHLQHTGHVLAALSRAATAPPSSVGQLTGSVFPLAEPGASGLVLVPAELLTAAELSAPPAILTAFWRWYVDTGGKPVAAPATPEPKPVTGTAPTVQLNAGSLSVSSAGDGKAPVLALVHPTGHWGTGTTTSLQIRATLDANGVAQLGNGAVTLTDEALVFVRGRPVVKYAPAPVIN